MAARAALLEPPSHITGHHLDDPMDHAMADAHQALAEAIDDLNAGGILLDVAGLRRLHRCTAAALTVAISYERRTGRCGYPCRLPGLHCPEREALPTVRAALQSEGWQPAGRSPSRQVTCICGAPMEPTSLRLGRRTRSWAACPECGHWVTL